MVILFIIIIVVNIVIYVFNNSFCQKNESLQYNAVLAIAGVIRESWWKIFSMFGLKQLIEVPRHVNRTSSTMIDHIPASYSNRV